VARGSSLQGQNVAKSCQEGQGQAKYGLETLHKLWMGSYDVSKGKVERQALFWAWMARATQPRRDGGSPDSLVSVVGVGVGAGNHGRLPGLRQGEGYALHAGRCGWVGGPLHPLP